MPYLWKRITATSENIEDVLNSHDPDWEVFQILPTLHFEKTKIVMGVSVPLPGEVQYDVILRKLAS